MKKVFLFLASFLVAFAANATTYSVTIQDSQLDWSQNSNGQMESRISLTSITSLLKKGDQVKISYSGGNQKNSPYTVAIIDQSSAAEWWYELSDWTDAIELNASGSGSATVTLTATAMDKGSIIAFFVYDIIPETTKNWDFQYEGLFYKIQSDGSVWVTHGSEYSTESGEYYSSYRYTYHYYTRNEAITSKDITIPYEVNNGGKSYIVRGIDAYAFVASYERAYYGDDGYYSYFNINSIAIPSTVTYIGSDAFDINYLYLDDIQTWLKYGNLEGNSYSDIYLDGQPLKDLVIPETITSLDHRFSYCKNITSFTISENTDVTNAGLYFEKDDIRYRILNSNEVSVVAKYSESDYPNNIVIPGVVSAGNTFSVVSIENNAFRGCTGLTSIVIPNNVNSVGDNAFGGCTNLKTVIIGENVESIGSSAFGGCSSLTKITCYAVEPPTVDVSSFSNYNGYLTIPCDNFDSYDIHAVWGTFKHVDCISAESVDIEKDEVVVEPDVAKAAFSMPIYESANSYTLTIQNNGVTFCTISFNANGQLTNIDFSTTKSYELKSDVAAYQFTVTGLSAATDYGYSFKALASNKSVLKEYSGSFTTKNADGTGGSVQGGGEGSGQGGQGTETAIDGVSNANAVTIVSNQILVNGEAPAFVVTVSGQKIANKDLNSGVYFVTVAGETVKVAIK